MAAFYFAGVICIALLLQHALGRTSQLYTSACAAIGGGCVSCWGDVHSPAAAAACIWRRLTVVRHQHAQQRCPAEWHTVVIVMPRCILCYCCSMSGYLLLHMLCKLRIVVFSFVLVYRQLAGLPTMLSCLAARLSCHRPSLRGSCSSGRMVEGRSS